MLRTPENTGKHRATWKATQSVIGELCKLISSCAESDAGVANRDSPMQNRSEIPNSSRCLPRTSILATRPGIQGKRDMTQRTALTRANIQRPISTFEQAGKDNIEKLDGADHSRAPCQEVPEMSDGVGGGGWHEEHCRMEQLLVEIECPSFSPRFPLRCIPWNERHC